MLMLRFRDVKIHQAFDFEESGFIGCIKTSARGYMYLHGSEYWKANVGTVDVMVSNVRDAYEWELSLAGLFKQDLRVRYRRDSERQRLTLKRTLTIMNTVPEIQAKPVPELKKR